MRLAPTDKFKLSSTAEGQVSLGALIRYLQAGELPRRGADLLTGQRDAPRASEARTHQRPPASSLGNTLPSVASGLPPYGKAWTISFLRSVPEHCAERILYYEYLLRDFVRRIQETGRDPEEITGWRWQGVRK
jgi:hypothetical protein